MPRRPGPRAIQAARELAGDGRRLQFKRLEIEQTVPESQCHAGSGCLSVPTACAKALSVRARPVARAFAVSWTSVPLPEAPPVGVALKVASSLPRRPAVNRAASAVRVASTVGAVRAPVILPSRAR